MVFFNNRFKSERVPFIIYADTESLIKSIQTCEPCPQSSYLKDIKSMIQLVSHTLLNALMTMYLNQY